MRTETRPCQAKSPMPNMTPSGLRPHTVSESSLCEPISWGGPLWPAAECARACVKEADHEHSEPPSDRRCSGVRVHPGSLEQQHREDCPGPANEEVDDGRGAEHRGISLPGDPLDKVWDRIAGEEGQKGCLPHGSPARDFPETATSVICASNYRSQAFQ